MPPTPATSIRMRAPEQFRHQVRVRFQLMLGDDRPNCTLALASVCPPAAADSPAV
jgi:hypothetical protein